MPQPRILIIGGGFGGLFTALELGGSLNVTLLTDEDHFVFTPMLYEYFSGEVEEWHIAPRYDELVEGNVDVVVAKATSVDLNAKTVSLENRSASPANQQSTLPYDVLVLA